MTSQGHRTTMAGLNSVTLQHPSFVPAPTTSIVGRTAAAAAPAPAPAHPPVSIYRLAPGGAVQAAVQTQHQPVVQHQPVYVVVGAAPQPTPQPPTLSPEVPAGYTLVAGPAQGTAGLASYTAVPHQPQVFQIAHALPVHGMVHQQQAGYYTTSAAAAAAVASPRQQQQQQQQHAAGAAGAAPASAAAAPAPAAASLPLPLPLPLPRSPAEGSAAAAPAAPAAGGGAQAPPCVDGNAFGDELCVDDD
eukprot:Rhum_TRINITY_DN13633_c5_g1::Rhum_TRINITY_DN13633_c5_g1_i1::g.62392::m.62392